MKAVTVLVKGQVHGRFRMKLGVALIRCGAWLCRAYRIEITANGKTLTTLHPHADVQLSMRKKAA